MSPIAQQGEHITSIDEAKAKIKELSRQIPEQTLTKWITNIIMGLSQPQPLNDTIKGKTYTKELSYLQVTDHIQIDWVEREENTYPNIQPGRPIEGIVHITMPKDPDLDELAGLVKAIQQLRLKAKAETSNQETNSQPAALNGVDVEQLDAWLENLKTYSQNLRQAALAMVHIQKQAVPKLQESSLFDLRFTDHELNENIDSPFDFDCIYALMAEFIFNLSLLISPSPHDQTDLEQEYENLKQQHNDSKLETVLQPGLTFGRYGDKKRSRNQHKATFEKMVKVYQRLRSRWKKTDQSISLDIINSIINQTLPKHLETSRQKYIEGQQLPQGFLAETFLKGVERMYHKLPIPLVIKELIEADIDKLDDTALSELVKDLDKVFQGSYFMPILDFYSNTIVTNYIFKIFDKKNKLTNISLSELLSEIPITTRNFLKKWQEELKTLGLGQKNLETFSQWLENDQFLKHVDLGKTKFAWQKDKNITSIPDAVDFYHQRPRLKNEFARFQMTILSMIIDQMRLNYGGWLQDQPFQGLKDASPSEIIQHLRLNCVGRSNLLMQVGRMLDIQIYPAYSFEHRTNFSKFTDKFEVIIDPSTSKGYEFEKIQADISQLHPNLLLPGERLAKTANGQIYLIKNQDNIHHSLTNYFYYLPNNHELITSLSYLFTSIFTPTDIHNFFGILYGQKKLKQSDINLTRIEDVVNYINDSVIDYNFIVWLLKRLIAVDPSYVEDIKTKSHAFQQLMKRLIDQAKKADLPDDYKPPIWSSRQPQLQEIKPISKQN